MKPKLAFAWFLVSLALTALLVVQWRNSHQQKQTLENVQLQVEKLVQQEKAATSRVKELEMETRRLRGQLHAAEIEASGARFALNAARQNAPAGEGGGATPGAGAQGEQGRGGAGMGSFLANMMKDPEMRKAMEQQQRMGLDMVYGALFKELQLTPEQEKEFKDALLAMQMTNMVQAGTLFDAANTNRTELAQSLAEDRKKAEERLKEIVGEEKYQRFQDYSQTLGERMMLEQFARQAQVTPEQNEQLLAIIAEEKKNMQINMGAQGLDPNRDWPKLIESGEATEHLLAQQEQVNERVLARANEILSPEQVEKFRPFMTNQMAMQRAGLKMARQMFQGQSPPALAPAPQ